MPHPPACGRTLAPCAIAQQQQQHEIEALKGRCPPVALLVHAGCRHASTSCCPGTGTARRGDRRPLRCGLKVCVCVFVCVCVLCSRVCVSVSVCARRGDLHGRCDKSAAQCSCCSHSPAQAARATSAAPRCSGALAGRAARREQPLADSALLLYPPCRCALQTARPVARKSLIVKLRSHVICSIF